MGHEYKVSLHQTVDEQSIRTWPINEPHVFGDLEIYAAQRSTATNEYVGIVKEVSAFCEWRTWPGHWITRDFRMSLIA